MYRYYVIGQEEASIVNSGRVSVVLGQQHVSEDQYSCILASRRPRFSSRPHKSLGSKLLVSMRNDSLSTSLLDIDRSRRRPRLLLGRGWRSRSIRSDGVEIHGSVWKFTEASGSIGSVWNSPEVPGSVWK